jgi:hypothetical protein
MPLPGPKVLLLGEPGSGKTYSTATLLKAGVTPYYIFTEDTMAVVSKAAKELRISEPVYHYKYLPARAGDLSLLLSSFKRFVEYSHEVNTKHQDINKARYKQVVELVYTLQDFKCDCCNVSHGDVSEWRADRALVVDGLTGLNKMFRDGAVGGRLYMTQPEWGAAMDAEIKFIDTLLQFPCSIVLIAHVEPEKDEIHGGTRLYAGALGQKNGPRLPGSFSEVILSSREGKTFSWSTIADRTSTKARLLPLSDKLSPSFELLYREWQNNGGTLEGPTNPTPSQT